MKIVPLFRVYIWHDCGKMIDWTDMNWSELPAVSKEILWIKNIQLILTTAVYSIKLIIGKPLLCYVYIMGRVLMIYWFEIRVVFVMAHRAMKYGKLLLHYIASDFPSNNYLQQILVFYLYVADDETFFLRPKVYIILSSQETALLANCFRVNRDWPHNLLCWTMDNVFQQTLHGIHCGASTCVIGV